MKKFKTWEKEHSDALKRINSKIQELKHDKETFRFSASGCTGVSRKSEALQSEASTCSSSVRNRKAETAVKIVKLETKLVSAAPETERTAALKEQGVT